MTAKITEDIIFEGNEYSLASEPLRSYLETRDDIEFQGFMTSCWRGYAGTWQLFIDQLF